MQETIGAAGGAKSRLPNPLLDLAVACLEAQLKSWQAYQVEGTRFVAKRMRCNLEHLQALGHCCDIQSTSECQRAWMRDIQQDYAEEWGRIVATTFALGFGELSGFGCLFGQRPARETSEPQREPPSGQKLRSGLQAAA